MLDFSAYSINTHTHTYRNTHTLSRTRTRTASLFGQRRSLPTLLMGLLLDNSTYRGNAAICNIICHTQQQHICMHCIINQLNIHTIYTQYRLFFLLFLCYADNISMRFVLFFLFCFILFVVSLLSFLFHTVCRASKLLFYFLFCMNKQFESVSARLSQCSAQIVLS